MNIQKHGDGIEFDFKCIICGCEFSADSRECREVLFSPHSKKPTGVMQCPDCHALIRSFNHRTFDREERDRQREERERKEAEIQVNNVCYFLGVENEKRKQMIDSLLNDSAQNECSGV